VGLVCITGGGRGDEGRVGLGEDVAAVYDSEQTRAIVGC
jgi:hypothetical protein